LSDGDNALIEEMPGINTQGNSIGEARETFLMPSNWSLRNENTIAYSDFRDCKETFYPGNHLLFTLKQEP
jgi:hypothetical protein